VRATSSVLARFPEARLLGEGSESQVFALSETTILRVPKGGSAGFWERRRAFCDRLAGLDLGGVWRLSTRAERSGRLSR
jgi:hypothetical protein